MASTDSRATCGPPGGATSRSPGRSTTIPTTIPRSSSATCSLRVMDGRSIWQRASAPLAAPTAFNFGAPGARTDEEGLQWIPVGENAKRVVVKGEKLDWFKLHPASVGGWLGATGVLGANEIAIATPFQQPKAGQGSGKRTCDVRLHFLDPASSKLGERVFSVALEGRVVLEDFDIAREATPTARRVVRSFAMSKSKALSTFF